MIILSFAIRCNRQVCTQSDRHLRLSKLKSIEMRRVKETVASVCGAFAGELVVREAKCDKTKICVKVECLERATRRH